MDYNDVKENDILRKYPELLDIILIDRSSGKNLIWATSNYALYGKGYQEHETITPRLITGKMRNLIKPRTNKSQREQKKRSKDMAEVFTPSWMCNKQNNLIDEAWFGCSNVFNIEKDNSWIVTEKIEFKNRCWEDYIKETRLEITCGEAPYLVSRYDATTGEYLNVRDRIGLLDRKLRVINENVSDKEEWYKWVLVAYKNVYGFDYQGDNIILARENLLYDFIENYEYKFNEEPLVDQLIEVAKIISWNIWQMDGLKYVVPLSCHKENTGVVQLLLFGDEEEQVEDICKGCKLGDNRRHNGIYCKIRDWETNKIIRFIDLFKEEVNFNV